MSPTSNKGYPADLAHTLLDDENKRLRDRNSQLEAALRKYGGHINDCPQNYLQPDCDYSQRCTCGLAALQGAK
jgi:hypothetical protein